MINFSNKSKYFRATDGVMVYLLGLVGIFAVSSMVSGALLYVLDSIVTSYPTVGEVINMGLNALIQVALVGVYYFYISKLDARPQICIKKTHPVAIILGAVTAVIALLGFIVPATLFDNLLIKIGYVMTAFEVQTVAGKVALVFVTVICAPIGEELIFRSALLSGLKRKFSAPICILINGIAFSLMHMNPAQTVYQFALGCALASVALASGSVIPAMVGHMTSNLIACLIEFFPEGLNKIFLPIINFGMKNAVCVIILVVLAVALHVVIYFVIKRFGKDEENIQVVEPEFFDSDMQPVFATDPYYAQKHEAHLSSGEGDGRDGRGLQGLLRKRYDAKHSECGGIFGKNTFAVGLAVGLAFCAVMWLLSLLVMI